MNSTVTGMADRFDVKQVEQNGSLSISVNIAGTHGHHVKTPILQKRIYIKELDAPCSFYVTPPVDTTISYADLTYLRTHSFAS